MKIIAFAVTFGILLIGSDAIKDWMNHELYSCVQCLCHARSGCWFRENCARYSISFDYWQKGGSLIADINDLPNSQESYKKCMRNENCIVGTIIQYTGKFGERDCNCDGRFDCKDRLAIHLNGANCAKPVFGNIYAARFNECAAKIGVATMLSSEGDDYCTVPEVN